MISRMDAVREIMGNIKDEDIAVTACGMISREVHAVKDRPRNFYMMGSMGNELAIGLGIAMNINEKVIVISGDAGTLMSLGTLVLHKKLNPKNLVHYILDNGCHSSTGGQPTCSDKVNFELLAPNTRVIRVSKEKGDAPRIQYSPLHIKERFMNAVNNPAC